MDTRTPPADPAPRRVLIRRKEVEELTGLSQSTIYEWMRQGNFPHPVRVGPHTVRWYLDEVMHFIHTRPRCR